jgi:nicotinamidase-related amidase
MLLNRKDCFLLVVDIQERLAPAVLDREQVVANAERLVRAATRLEVPVLMTEHCTAKIGPVLAGLRALVPPDAVLPKVHFAAQREPGCAARFTGLGRSQCVIAGLETHVCVLQTAISLKEAGYRTFVASDAVSSRRPTDKETALARLRDAGIGLVTCEMAIFEWLARGDDPAFRDLLPLIKGGDGPQGP